MADAQLNLLLSLQDNASSKLGEFEGKLNDMGYSLNKVSMAAVAMGTAMVASIGSMVNAAAEDAESEARLANVVDNTGQSYLDLKDSIDAALSAQMAHTNYSKTEQQDAMSRLVVTTGDWAEAMGLLTVAMDVAASKNMDLDSAAQLVGKVFEGDVTALGKFGIATKDLEKSVVGSAAATQALVVAQNNLTAAQATGDIGKITKAQKAYQAALEDTQKVTTVAISGQEAIALVVAKVGGMAEATANPLTIMKNVFGEVASTIGSALLPVVQKIADILVPFLQKLTTWIENNKGLAAFITGIVVAIGGILIVLGTIGLVLPKIADGIKICRAAWHLLNQSFIASPIGILIGLIIAAIILLVTQFDHLKEGWEVIHKFLVNSFNAVKDAFVTAWNFIKNAFETVFHGIYNTFATVINMLMAGIEKFVNFFIAGINVIIRGLNAIPFVNIGEIKDIKLPRIEKLAEGGNVTAGGLAMVGERGPELLNLPKGASVTPLDKGGGGAVTVNVTVQGSMLSNASELAAIIREELLKTSRRLGGTATGALGFA